MRKYLSRKALGNNALGNNALGNNALGKKAEYANEPTRGRVGSFNWLAG
jgi:hypothetical protein